MTPEQAALLTDLKAVYGELFPYRDPDAMRYDDSLLALGVLMERKLAMKIDKLPPAHADGVDPRVTAKTRRKASR